MRIFEHFPTGKECPICNSKHDSECWLMEVDGTEDGNNIEAIPVHTSCTGKHMIGRMRYNKAHGILYSKIEEVIEVKEPPICGSGPCQYDRMLAN